MGGKQKRNCTASDCNRHTAQAPFSSDTDVRCGKLPGQKSVGKRHETNNKKKILQEEREAAWKVLLKRCKTRLFMKINLWVRAGQQGTRRFSRHISRGLIRKRKCVFLKRFFCAQVGRWVPEHDREIAIFQTVHSSQTNAL